ncbi:hypothetical protein [Marinicella rhabdoformis]|uniref:hypothetical protein n=1 Tax=Marinicella rhabdoformis TaxID=2580566 RepID=UPI0012AEBE21|nr:hypothetical protein [Marinicella rhabdoformis]
MSDLSDLVLQKIGRNVVNLSKIEGMLKLFLSRVNFQCEFSQLEATLAKQKKQYETLTLGQLANAYFKTFNSDTGPIHDMPVKKGESWISFSFDTETEETYDFKKTFETLVFERNRLVHEMLIEFNPVSKDSCNDLNSELDQQNKIIQIEYKQIQNKLYLLHYGIKQFILEQYKETTGKECESIDELLRQ